MFTKNQKNNEIKWPEVEKEFINNEINNIVVQINGKKRSIISTNTEMDEKTILKKKFKKIDWLKNILMGEKY